MNKSFLTPATALIVSLLLMACSSYQVKTDFDETTDFSTLSTFAWTEANPVKDTDSAPSPLLVARIHDAITANLQAKQYVLANAGKKPDFLVNFVLESKERTGVTASPYSFGLGFHHHNFYSSTTVSTYQFTEGSIAIDFYMSEDKRPIWRGSANKNFMGFHADVSVEQVTEVVNRVLQAFPPTKEQTKK